MCSTNPCNSDNMSVFQNFQKAWSKKFPGASLPQAWEEDIKANLVAHQSRLDVLKEELEKEESYVQYLECLLEDIERSKTGTIEQTNFTDEVGDGQECTNKIASDNLVSEMIGPESELVSSEFYRKRSNTLSEVPPPVLESHTINKKRYSENFVTVIKVNSDDKGLKSDELSSTTSNNTKELESKTESCDSLSSLEVDGNSSLKSNVSQCDTTNKMKDKRSTCLSDNALPKVPPRPPPKSFRYSSGTAQTLTNGANISSLVDSVPDNTVSKTKIDKKVESSYQNERIIRDEVIYTNIPLNTVKMSSSSLSEPLVNQIVDDEINIPDSEIIENNVKSDSSESKHTPTVDELLPSAGTQDEINLSNEEDIDDRDHIYDSVPLGGDDDEEEEDLDGDYVLLVSDKVVDNGNKIIQKSRNSSGEGSTLLSQKSVKSSASGTDSTDPNNSPILTDGSGSVHYPNYVNMEFFIQREKNTLGFHGSLESEEEEEVPPLLRQFSSDHEDAFESEGNFNNSTSESLDKSQKEDGPMYKHVIKSILESEKLYLECMNILLKYMKALKATLTTSQPVISPDDFNAIFYKVPELWDIQKKFYDGIDNAIRTKESSIGQHFKAMALNMEVYDKFLHNYPHAVETVRKCSCNSVQFGEITRSIKLPTTHSQSITLEDLLHKPVARIQKNALVIQDLLKYTPENEPNYPLLCEAYRLVQIFLSKFSMAQAESLFPSQDRANQRHLVKNTFIVELVEGHRKLRHIFLFSDVLVCSKCKASARVEKLSFEVKWFIPLSDIVIPFEEGEAGGSVRENSPPNLLHLKSQASTVRDQIMRQESREKIRVGGRSLDKNRKKLAELEGQLVLASPNLVFRVAHVHKKVYTFFLSSEFERSQWIEAIQALQASMATPVTPSLSQDEVQIFITDSSKFLKSNIGSFFLRSSKDEELLVGDLSVGIQSLQGLDHAAAIFICLELDSYGHFFRKAKTNCVPSTFEPVWNQEFVLDLEGSQNLRILCYEEIPDQGTVLIGKATLELSRNWLKECSKEQRVPIQNTVLNMSIKFISSEMTLRRAPATKSSSLFGVKISQVCKKEKRNIPFLLTSCVHEVERRGMGEVGLYRVSGSSSDINKLKKTFETNLYEAEHLLKEVDVHSITSLLKLYLRELPEALFTDDLYPQLFEAFNLGEGEHRRRRLLQLSSSLPSVNKTCIRYLLDHMIRVNQHEQLNKMSLHNLATVFGPTLLRPGAKSESAMKSDLLAAGTVDVMAQAGILYFFLQKRLDDESLFQ